MRYRAGNAGKQLERRVAEETAAADEAAAAGLAAATEGRGELVLREMAARDALVEGVLRSQLAVLGEGMAADLDEHSSQLVRVERTAHTVRYTIALLPAALCRGIMIVPECRYRRCSVPTSGPTRRLRRRLRPSAHWWPLCSLSATRYASRLMA